MLRKRTRLNLMCRVCSDTFESVVLVVAELGYKDVLQRHWWTRVLNFCKENQIPVGPSELMVMYDDGNFLRWA